MLQDFASLELNLISVHSDLVSDKLISYNVVNVCNEALFVKCFRESVPNLTLTLKTWNTVNVTLLTGISFRI